SACYRLEVAISGLFNSRVSLSRNISANLHRKSHLFKFCINQILDINMFANGAVIGSNVAELKTIAT
ncbi:MAG: hypothetical protein ABJK39_00845, partial [Hyphomicrobiales bacterium]